LLDLLMPDISGFDVLSALKSDDALRDIPVIMISALNEIDSIVRCIEAGADDYELCWIFGDGVNHAADFSSLATSMPSRNVTPLTTFGN
jgi:response regulator of citrate/malate metabolism